MIYYFNLNLVLYQAFFGTQFTKGVVTTKVNLNMKPPDICN